MIELKNKYRNKNAIIIFGGPSILENNYDLSLLSNNDIIFLESKALTPKFMEFGIKPDYYFAPYPEKTRTNTLQHIFMQAISCGFELNKSLKKAYVDEWKEFKDRFGEYADIWRIEYPHKRYRIKKDVVLENSPLSLLENFPNMGFITYDVHYDWAGMSELELPNPIFKFSHVKNLTDNEDKTYDFDEYFNPKIVNDKLIISNMGLVNSSAISLYPILNFMGFDKVFFIGMDMSMLGSFEFSPFYTFKSMNHFGKFFNSSRSTFSHTFPVGFQKGVKKLCYSIYKDLKLKNTQELCSLNRFKKLQNDVYGLEGKFLRTKEEMRDCNKLVANKHLDFINVYESFKYAKPIPKIKNLSFSEFINNN